MLTSVVTEPATNWISDQEFETNDQAKHFYNSPTLCNQGLSVNIFSNLKDTGQSI